MTTASPIQPIRDENSYQAALAEVRASWGAEPGTPEGDRLDVLLVLLEVYETVHHGIDLPDPIEAIKLRMEDLGIGRERPGALLGIGSGRVSEALNRRCRPTLEMIRVLAVELKLPEGCLIQVYDLVPPKPRAAGHRSVRGGQSEAA